MGDSLCGVVPLSDLFVCNLTTPPMARAPGQISLSPALQSLTEVSRWIGPLDFSPGHGQETEDQAPLLCGALHMRWYYGRNLAKFFF